MIILTHKWHQRITKIVLHPVSFSLLGLTSIILIDQMIHIQPSQVSTLYEENGDAIVLAACSGWNASSFQ